MKYCSFCPRGNYECYGSENSSFRPIELTVEKAEADLLVALLRLYNENYDLIKRGVNERCITNYVFHYFMVEKAKEYPGYHIDPEYNKNGEKSKDYNKYGEESKEENRKSASGIPDLIIHRRECNKENLLIIEFKTTTDLKPNDKDKDKLVGFTKLHESERREKTDYEFALGCNIFILPSMIEFHWYKNGKELPISKYGYSPNTENPNLGVFEKIESKPNKQL